MNAKHLFSNVTLLFIAASLLLAACAPATPEKDLSDPLTLVTEYYAAIESNDIPKAMSYVSEDYVMTDPSGFTVGKEAATTAWNGYIDAGFTFDQSDFKADGNRVTSCYKVYEKGNLIDEGCGAVTHVSQGKVIFDGLAPAEQIWVVQEYYEALNAGDIETAMALVSEDVKCRGACYLNGKTSFRSFMQGSINMGGRVELRDLQVDGDKVSYNWTAYNTDDVPVALGTETLQIENGLIILMETQTGSVPVEPAE